MFNSGYNNFYPYQSIGAKAGLFSLFKGKINWSSLLNNTQKTLNIINQAIPVFYQVKPMWNNTKTILKIIGAVKEDNTKNSSNNNTYINNKEKNLSEATKNYTNDNYSNNNTPNFFL